MAENNSNAENNDNNETTKTDIFKQQEQTIITLQDILRKQAEEETDAAPQQIIYARQAEPAKKPPNYLLYIALGVLALAYFRKKG